ncbi:MAG: glycine zipper domain-containing protein [Alphaproteobacteria bacterium]
MSTKVGPNQGNAMINQDSGWPVTVRTRRPLCRIFAAAMVAALLGGCLTDGGRLRIPHIFSADLTPAQQQLRERADTFNQTVWEGVAIGAAVGATIAFFTTSDDDDRVRNTMIGAAGGAAAGGIASSYIASKQEDYADREDVLDSMIVDVRQKNVESEQLIEAMRAVLEEDNRKLESLRAQLDSGEITRADYQGDIARIDADRVEMQGAVDSAGEQLGTFKSARHLYQEENTDVDTAQLNNEIATLQGRIATMNDIVADLGSGELA